MHQRSQSEEVKKRTKKKPLEMQLIKQKVGDKWRHLDGFSWFDCSLLASSSFHNISRKSD